MIVDLNKAKKFFLLIVTCLVFRLIPFRAPNIEPITAALMPLGRAYGSALGFFFGVLSVLSYDFFTNTFGVHTFFTAGAFGLLGLWSGVYFKSAESKISGYVKFAVVGTLAFDVITGLMPGPIFYGQPFALALAGQIPFTMLHLAGNIIFAVTLSPAIHYLLVKKRKPYPEISPTFSAPNFNHKII